MEVREFHIGNKSVDVYKTHKCLFCDNIVHVHMDEETYIKVVNGEDFIQNILPDYSLEDREFFITGMCPECQKDIFG